MEALKSASTMLAELRTSSLTPVSASSHLDRHSGEECSWRYSAISQKQYYELCKIQLRASMDALLTDPW